MNSPSLVNPPLSESSWRRQKRYATVLGRRLAYVERGSGLPVVLLHGNPTSSFLWRNVLPHLEGLGRLIAPDLIGMGDSDKLESDEPDRYRFASHARYLETFLAHVGADRNVTLVLHDWGGALGFDWASRHQAAVRGMAYMETLVRPISYADLAESFHPLLRAVRSAEGEHLVLRENVFIEKMLPGLTQKHLSEEEMMEYRRPFSQPGDGRLATLVWPRELPIDCDPADVTERMTAYSEWLKQSTVPKLFINVDPGAFVTGSVRELCRSFPNQEEVTVAGLHFPQEDSPDALGAAVARWVKKLR